jgi:vacuolar-type H+-ATPase subunit C/Vma6
MINAGDADHLAARLHGRRSRMAEGERLRALCSLGSPRELGQALFPGAGIASCAAVQARLEQELALELSDMARGMTGPRGAFMRWLAARLQAENLKLAIRALFSGSGAREAAGLAGHAGPGVRRAWTARGRRPAAALRRPPRR